MLSVLSDVAIKKTYWAVLIMASVLMELVALYYQYILDEWPCVLCIHVRIWIMALIMISVAALFLKNSYAKVITTHSLATVVVGILLERSWILLGVERGTIFGSCNMDLGLPWWLALDKWVPFMFEVKTACGYTPELVFGITMAEGLMVFSAVMLLISLLLLMAVIKNRRSLKWNGKEN